MHRTGKLRRVQGPLRPRRRRPGSTSETPGQPGVRLRCYLDVRQELNS
ncbi:DUF6207 family protein [Streptomyces mirabilis]